MSRWLAEMTCPEVAQAVAAGATTVILPLGATEQHGPHLPLGTDTFRAAALADRLAAHLPGALVAPVLPLGCSDEHCGFAGLLGLEHATLAGVIVESARRMAAWGIRRLILLSAHGGNEQALSLAGQRLREAVPTLEVCMPGSLTTLPAAVLAAAQDAGIAPEAFGLHAGEGETSEMLHLHPELVQMQHAAPGYTGDMAAVLPVLQQAGLHGVTANGVLGDPRAADGTRGTHYLDAAARHWLRACQHTPGQSEEAKHGDNTT
jgi:creatinine amidohydrolase